MTKPTIELRKISHAKSLSEETPAYSADVYVDGKLFCHVSNHGQGGPDEQHPPKGMTNSQFQPLLEALERRIVETYPSHPFRIGDEIEHIEESFEGLCQSALIDADIAKSLKRDLAKKIVFQKPDGIYTVKRTTTGQDAQLIAIIKQKHGIARTLNEMPFAEALAVYKSAA